MNYEYAISIIEKMTRLTEIMNKEKNKRSLSLFRDVFLSYLEELKDVIKTEDNSPTLKEVEIGLYSGKIAAIREYRMRTGATLLEAKIALEKYFNDKGYKFFL